MQPIIPEKQALSNTALVALLLPLILIIALVIAAIFIAPTGYSQIVDRVNSYTKKKEREQLLTQKVSLLQNMSPTTLEKTPQSVSVLPDKNPIFSVIIQIKELALANTVAASQFKSINISEFGDDIQKLDFTIHLEASDFQSMSKFINELALRAPFATVELSEMKNETSGKSADVRIATYWSKLPETLPKFDEPVEQFSSEELKTLDALSQYVLPELTILSPQTQGIRGNPFN